MSPATGVLPAEARKVRAAPSLLWCLAAGALIPWAFSVVLFGLSEFPQELATTQWGYRFGMPFVAVAGALAIASEISNGAVSYSVLATPARWRVLLSKAFVIAALSVPAGLAGSVGSWLIALGLQGDAGPGLSLTTVADVRMVLAAGAVYPVAAVIGVAVGALIGRPAPTVALLLLWPVLVETVLVGLPAVGESLEKVLPFRAAEQFVFDDIPQGFPPIWALMYMAVFAGVLLAGAVAHFDRQDL